MATQEDVVPIWGIQRESELDQFLECVKNGVELTEERLAAIEKDRRELAGEFCRGCGYCMPCPANISIRECARVALMLRRSDPENLLTEEWQKKMKQIEQCINCGRCAAKCPYGLNTPQLLRANYEDYFDFLANWKK